MVSEAKIENMLKVVDLKSENSIKSAVNTLLTEAEFAVGTKVCSAFDPTFPAEGLVGTVQGKSANPGFTDVKFADGRISPLQTSLLIAL